MLNLIKTLYLDIDGNLTAFVRQKVVDSPKPRRRRAKDKSSIRVK